MSDHRRKRGCPIPEDKLRRFELDGRSWRLLILSPAVELILSDGTRSDAEQRFLDRHPLRRNSPDRAKDFIPRLLRDREFRADATSFLADTLRHLDDGDREDLIEDIEDNLFEVALCEQVISGRRADGGGTFSEGVLQAIDDILTDLGLRGRMARHRLRFGNPKIEKYEYRDLVPKAGKQSSQTVAKRAGEAESVAARIRENPGNPDAWEDDCLDVLEACLVRFRSEYDSPAEYGQRLAEGDRSGAPYFHRGVGVLPAPEEEEKVYFVGDLHGDYETLERVLEVTEYLGDDGVRLFFLGDYVDRGKWSLPVLLRIMELKLEDWDRIQMLRGNHEALRKIVSDEGSEESWASATGNQEFVEDVGRNFEGSTYLWELFQDLFGCMTHFLFLGEEIAVCHGGVIPRFPDEDPLKGQISEELKADLAVANWLDLAKPKVEYYLRWARCDWKPQVAYIWNGDSLSSKCFDYGDVETFLDRLGVKTLVRGHDHPGEGYFVAEECPRMVTLCTSSTVNMGNFRCTPKVALCQRGGEFKVVDL